MLSLGLGFVPEEIPNNRRMGCGVVFATSMRGTSHCMSRVTIGHGRVTPSRRSGVAGMNDRIIEARDVAELICAIAYRDGRTGGVYAAALEILPRRLNLPQRTIDEALVAGENGGWLRRHDGRVELTAAGLYVAKLVLKLPT